MIEMGYEEDMTCADINGIGAGGRWWFLLPEFLYHC